MLPWLETSPHKPPRSKPGGFFFRKGWDLNKSGSDHRVAVGYVLGRDDWPLFAKKQISPHQNPRKMQRRTSLWRSTTLERHCSLAAASKHTLAGAVSKEQSWRLRLSIIGGARRGCETHHGSRLRHRRGNVRRCAGCLQILRLCAVNRSHTVTHARHQSSSSRPTPHAVGPAAGAAPSNKPTVQTAVHVRDTLTHRSQDYTEPSTDTS